MENAEKKKNFSQDTLLININANINFMVIWSFKYSVFPEDTA